MKKETLKTIIKPLIVLVIISLPFVTVTNILGIETFLDSFENPESYICLQDDGNWFSTKTTEQKYVIIQRSSHPEFTIEDNDEIIYCKSNGEIDCNKIKQEQYHLSSIKRYYAVENNKLTGERIFESQIIGKVVKIIDENPWNSLSIKLWEISIHNLNVKEL